MVPTTLVRVISIVVALALPAAAAEPLGGGRFITVMKRNTLSGTTADGAEFNITFVEGGRVSYQDSAGGRDDGTWRMDPDGDVCLRWTTLRDGAEECFEVTLDGRTVGWRGKTTTGEGMLRGGIAESFLEQR